MTTMLQWASMTSLRHAENDGGHILPCVKPAALLPCMRMYVRALVQSLVGACVIRERWPTLATSPRRGPGKNYVIISNIGQPTLGFPPVTYPACCISCNSLAQSTCCTPGSSGLATC